MRLQVLLSHLPTILDLSGVLVKLFYYMTYSRQFWIYLGSWSSCFIIRLTVVVLLYDLQVLLSNIYTDNSGFICDLIILSYDYGCQAAFSAQDEAED